jgi:hypothetical protein
MKILDHPEISQLDFKVTNGTYWNGKAQMPIESVIILLKTSNSETRINYEERTGEFTKVTIAGYVDENIFASETKIKNPIIKSSFEISAIGSIEKIFHRNESFKISTNNIELKKLLSESLLLKCIFEVVENSSDLSPELSGNFENESNEYCIKINYLTKTKNEELIILMIKFIEEISIKITTANSYYNGFGQLT